MNRQKRNRQKWKNLSLIRHGESTCNEVNRFAGAVDAPLSPLGEAQARKASKQWRDSAPDRIYASPLQRAHRTAELVFPDFATGIGAEETGVILDARIQERDFGDFTLRNKAFLQSEMGLANYETALYGDNKQNQDGESFSALYRRVLSFLRDELHPLLVRGMRIVVVAHKYVIELLARLILRMPEHGGYDLRLPNASLLNASKLDSYLRQESRFGNNLREWIVLNHSFLMMVSLALGLITHKLTPDLQIPPLMSMGLLTIAATIGLTRVGLRGSRSSTPVFSIQLTIMRYAVLPLGVGLIAYLNPQHEWLTWLAIIFAAPAAASGIIISRSTGGMVLPTAYTILGSTLVGALFIPLLLSLLGVTDVAGSVFVLLITSGSVLLIPIALSYMMRSLNPINTARFAEHNAAAAVLLIVLFIFLSAQRLDLDSFNSYGWYALITGIILRIVAFGMARRGSLYAIDDYVAMSYPNLFLVIILASLLQMDELSVFATWLLLPMFALAPVDQWLSKRFLAPSAESGLLDFLGITTLPVRDENMQQSIWK